MCNNVHLIVGTGAHFRYDMTECGGVDVAILNESIDDRSLIPHYVITDKLRAAEVALGVHRPANDDLSLRCR
jgi:hypothetical protein